MKSKWKRSIFVSILLSGLGGAFLTLTSPVDGTEANPLRGYAELGTLLASTQGSSSQNPYSQFFTENTLTVTKEGDGFLPGTLRTILLQAAGIRHNNPFSLVKINFDPTVKRIRINKGNLPPLEEGLVAIDCVGQVTFDGSLLDARYLEEGESPAGLILKSSGNTLKGCRFEGFAGHAIVVAGNRNQIRENRIGNPPVPKPAGLPAGAADDVLTNAGSGIFIADGASENLIENNEILGNKQDGVTFSTQAGPGNRIDANVFDENGRKGIHGGDNAYRATKPVLKPVVREGDSYILSGTTSEGGELEIALASASGKEGKMVIVPSFMTGRGDFSVSVKNKGFIPGSSKIVALLNAPGRNVSEFSEPALVLTDVVRSTEPAPLLSETQTREEVVAPPPAAEESDTTLPKPLNNRADSALSVGSGPAHGSFTNPAPSSPPSVDPFLNATTIPPPSPPPSPDTPSVQPSSPPSKSGESDSLRIDSVDVNGAP